MTRGPARSGMPTWRPSRKPTPMPTKRPTRAPTHKPTPEPTRATPRPTRRAAQCHSQFFALLEAIAAMVTEMRRGPIEVLTSHRRDLTYRFYAGPTPRPTTARPTRMPTRRPTPRPTTARPSPQPTRRPTPRPTAMPTRRPTPMPTRLPCVAESSEKTSMLPLTSRRKVTRIYVAPASRLRARVASRESRGPFFDCSYFLASRGRVTDSMISEAG